MADGTPHRRPSGPAPRRCRITLRTGPHRWTFAFGPGDAAVVIRRVAELEGDPDAPLDGAAAEVLRQQIAHTAVETFWSLSDPRAADPTV